MTKKRWIAVGLCIVVAVASLCLWDIDGDGIVNILDGSPTQYSFPATNYAKEKISSAIILEDLRFLDSDLTLDESETVFIDFLADFEQEQQYVIIQSFLVDGVISSEEMFQVQFLNTFTKDERVQLIENGFFYNFNWDGDSWSNYFEQSISKTPYDVKNDIYVIMMTMAGVEYPPVKEMFDILDGMKIPDGNIYDLTLEKNNAMDFEAAAKSLTERSDENDIVLFIINGEGSPGNFAFRDKTGMSSIRYTWFNELIDNIVSKNKVIIIDACYSGSAIRYFESYDKLILTCSADDQKGTFGTTYDFLKAFSNNLADVDKNGYISIGEAADYAKEIGTFESPGSPQFPQLSDLGNIGSYSYLAEFRLAK